MTWVALRTEEDEMAEARILTHIQYADRERRRMVAEYGLPLAEVTELYPAGSFLGRWWDYVEDAFNAGADFTLQAARRLDDKELRSLSRTTRGLREGLPRYYLKLASRKDKALTA